ncbi:hypothetical protein ABTO87_18135 [Acinetobacter baumannii]
MRDQPHKAPAPVRIHAQSGCNDDDTVMWVSRQLMSINNRPDPEGTFKPAG